MPERNPNSVDVPLSLFGGLDNDVGPSDLPEGLSPANNDVVFLPGSVASRPCLRRLYAQLPGSPAPTVTWIKTFRQANGNPLTLLLDSSGALWKEDIVNSPGTLTQIGQLPPGSRAKSVTAFAREYIAFSDGVNATAAPRQFDGTNLDRLTMDGPGAAPTVAPYLPPSAAIQNSGAGTPITISTAVPSDPQTFIVPSGGGDTGGSKFPIA